RTTRLEPGPGSARTSGPLPGLFGQETASSGPGEAAHQVQGPLALRIFVEAGAAPQVHGQVEVRLVGLNVHRRQTRQVEPLRGLAALELDSFSRRPVEGRLDDDPVAVT